MQTISQGDNLHNLGDNLHKMSKPILWEIEEKYFKILSAEIFTQSAKH